SVMAMIHETPLGRPAVSRASIAQPGILRHGRRLLEACHALCGHADNDRIGTCRLLCGEQCFTKACGIIGMRIDPDDERSQIAIMLDGLVAAAAFNSPG